jgi:hypothetical protein
MIQNECLETDCASVHLGQPQVTVKTGSEVETLLMRITSYDIRDNHQKIECDYQQWPKTCTFL